MDYVFCGELSDRDERRQVQHQRHTFGPTCSKSLPQYVAQHSVLTIRSRKSPEKQLKTPFKGIRKINRNYIFDKEIDKTAERAKILSKALESPKTIF